MKTGEAMLLTLGVLYVICLIFIVGIVVVATNGWALIGIALLFGIFAIFKWSPVGKRIRIL